MPLYDFHCAPCDRPFEASTPFVVATVHCPQCGVSTPRGVTVTKSYRVIGDNSSSSTPKRFNHGEKDRQNGKRDRLTGFYDKGGKW